MPKYNPKEARDAKARKQKRIAASKKKRHFRQFMPYILIIGVIIIVGSMAIYFYLSDYNNGEDGGENGGNGDNNQYGTPMTFTTIDEDTIKLADNQGKVIILYFFDLDCPPCGPQAEFLAEIDKDYFFFFFFFSWFFIGVCMDWMYYTYLFSNCHNCFKSRRFYWRINSVFSLRFRDYDSLYNYWSYNWEIKSKIFRKIN